MFVYFFYFMNSVLLEREHQHTRELWGRHPKIFNHPLSDHMNIHCCVSLISFKCRACTESMLTFITGFYHSSTTRLSRSPSFCLPLSLTESAGRDEEGVDVCQFFLIGKCHFGHRCRLSHRSACLILLSKPTSRI